MVDNVAVTPGTGATIGADDVGGVLIQRVKTTWGPDGTANDADVATGKPLPVQVRSATGLVPIGEPTDAKSTATDTTSASAISVLKQISASVQAPPSQAVTNAGTFAAQVDGAALTALQLIDDPVAVLGTATYTEATTKGMIAGAVRRDANTSLVDTTNEIAPLQVNATGELKVAQIQALPAGTNAIGKLAANSGVDIGDVDVGTINGVAPAFGDGAKGATVLRTTLATDSPGIITTGTIGNGNLSSVIVSMDTPANATSIAKLEDAASADGDKGIAAMFVRKATPANSSGTDGDYEFGQVSGGYLWVHGNKGFSNRAFRTTFATLTRPANTTAYTAADSISDNATAGSVTALVSGNISDVNDDPIFISEIHVNSTDTGLAGKKIRAYLFNANPTSSSGVGGGDNAAFSQKKAGYIGSFMGWMETGFSDGTVGRLVPCFNETNFTQAGGFIAALPVSGAQTLYIQYQAVEAFTPSANSTTIIGSAVGWQGRAV